MAELDAMSAQAAADELERFADNLRAEAGDPGNGWRANETYRAQKIFTQLKERAAELRTHARQRAEQAEAALRAVARVDRARNYGIGDTDG